MKKVKNFLNKKSNKKEEKLIAGVRTRKELEQAVDSFYKTTYPVMKKLAEE